LLPKIEGPEGARNRHRVRRVGLRTFGSARVALLALDRA